MAGKSHPLSNYTRERDLGKVCKKMEEAIKEIEQKIDVYHHNSAFFKLNNNNASQALVDIAIAFENGANRIEKERIELECCGFAYHEEWASHELHRLEDALKVTIRWIYKEYHADGSHPCLTIDKHRERIAEEYLNSFGKPYSAIQDAYLGWYNKIFDAECKANNTVFIAKANQMHAFLRNVNENEKNNESVFAREVLDIYRSEAYKKGIELLIDTIEVENGNLTYSTPHALADLIRRVGDFQWNESAEFPPEFEFDYFTLTDFKKCWIELFVWAQIHCTANIIIRSRSSHSEPVIIAEKVSIIRSLSSISGISENKVRAIVEFLTYDHSLSGADIMYQPLIEINEYLLIAPHTIMASNPERNFRMIIQMKGDKKYGSEVNTLERLMGNNIIAAFPKNTVYCVGKKLGDKKLPDVDIGIFDQMHNSILIAEMKWLVAADSTMEVLRRQQDINHGCEQVEMLLKYAIDDPIAFADKLFGLKPNDKPEIIGCVVSKHDVNATNQNIPVISERRFIQMAKEYSMSKLFQEIRNQKIFEELPEKKQMGNQTIEYAGYTFLIPSLVSDYGC